MKVVLMMEGTQTRRYTTMTRLLTQTLANTAQRAITRIMMSQATNIRTSTLSKTTERIMEAINNQVHKQMQIGSQLHMATVENKPKQLLAKIPV